MKEELVKTTGKVNKILGNLNYEVKIENTDSIVMCRPNGKMLRNNIRICVADRVEVEMSPYDLTRGRITYRHR